MEEQFEKYFNESIILTEKDLKQVNSKEYFNGEEKRVGDKYILVMKLIEDVPSSNPSYEIIPITENHIPLVEYIGESKNAGLEVVKLKIKNNG
jgi:hypothetical protein